jgi:hypothetical protein
MEKETASEQLRREAQKLRETAIELMEHATLLISKSNELETKIQKRDKDRK